MYLFATQCILYDDGSLWRGELLKVVLVRRYVHHCPWYVTSSWSTLQWPEFHAVANRKSSCLCFTLMLRVLSQLWRKCSSSRYFQLFHRGSCIPCEKSFHERNMCCLHIQNIVFFFTVLWCRCYMKYSVHAKTIDIAIADDFRAWI